MYVLPLPVRYQFFLVVGSVLLFGTTVLAGDQELKFYAFSSPYAYAAYWSYRMGTKNASLSLSSPLVSGFENAVNLSLTASGNESVKLYATICRNREADFPSLTVLSDRYDHVMVKPSSLIPPYLRCEFNISEPLLFIHVESEGIDNFGMIGVSSAKAYNTPTNSYERIADSGEKLLKMNETVSLPFMESERVDWQIIVLKGEIQPTLHGICESEVTFTNFSYFVGGYKNTVDKATMLRIRSQPHCVPPKDLPAHASIRLNFNGLSDDNVVRVLASYHDYIDVETESVNKGLSLLQIIGIGILIILKCILLGFVVFYLKKKLRAQRYGEQRRAAIKEAIENGIDGNVNAAFTSENEQSVIVLNGKPSNKNPEQLQPSVIKVTALTEIPLEAVEEPRISAFESTKL